jgi:hypothetical protein
MEPGSLIMERKMLLGIRDRAESAGLPRTGGGSGVTGRRRVGPDVPA